MNIPIYISIPLVFVLIICSCFFSSTEMAFSTVNQVRLKTEGKDGDSKSQRAYDLSLKFSSLVSTVLFGNDLVNVAISTLLYSITSLMGLDEIFEAIVSISISVVILLIFGEIIPKQLGRIYNYKIVRTFSSLVIVLKYIFLPFTFIVTLIGSAFATLFSKQKRDESVEVDDELQEMVDKIENEGAIDNDKAEMVKSAIEFNTTEAYEIMTPRVDVKMFDINDDFDEFLSDKSNFIYSRIPVYEDDKDNIIGILPLKIVERKILNNEKIDVRELMYKPLFIPQGMKIIDVLLSFRNEKHHMAIVIDEFGGVDGVITMEDILEELVGNIFDETDVIVEEYCQTDDGYLVDGSMNIDDFFDLVEETPEDDDSVYTTVGGWCTDKLEKFPKEGDTFIYKSLKIIILVVDNFTVEKIKVIIDKREDD